MHSVAPKASPSPPAPLVVQYGESVSYSHSRPPEAWGIKGERCRYGIGLQPILDKRFCGRTYQAALIGGMALNAANAVCSRR